MIIKFNDSVKNHKSREPPRSFNNQLKELVREIESIYWYRYLLNIISNQKKGENREMSLLMSGKY